MDSRTRSIRVPGTPLAATRAKQTMTPTTLEEERRKDRLKPDYEAECAGHNCAGLVLDEDKELCPSCRKRRTEERRRAADDQHFFEIQSRADDLQEEHPELTEDEAFAYSAVDEHDVSLMKVWSWTWTPRARIALDVVHDRRKLNGGDGQ